MKDQSQPNGSNFGPRLKVANGSSKGMLKAGKDYQKYKANMNLCNREHNVSDQRANIAKLANKNPLKDSNVGPSNALVANDSKSEYLQSSKHSWQPTSLSLENSLNPSPMDFKCSKPSTVWNILPSNKIEATTPLEPKDNPNATSRCLNQSHHLKPKDRLSRNMDGSRPPPLKAMAGLVHKEKDVDMSNLNKSTGQSNPYQGEDINVGKDIAETSKPVIEGSRSTSQSEREVSRKSNISTVSRLRVGNKDNSNKEKERQSEVMAKEKEMIGHAIEGCATFDNLHKQTDAAKAHETPSSSSLVVGKKFVQGVGSNLGDNSSHLFHKNHSRCQRNNASLMEGSNCARVSSKHVPPNEFIETNLKLPNRGHLVGGNGEINGDKFKMSKQPLLEEKLERHGIDSDGVVQQDQTCRPRKKGRFIEENEDEGNNGGEQSNMVVEHDGVHLENLTSVTTMKQGRCIETNEDDDGGYQNPVGVENDYERVEQLGIYKSKKKRRRYIETIEYEDDMCDQDQVRVEDGTNKLTQGATKMDCVDWHRCCCSKPIDTPRWTGIFKIDGKEDISLMGHLSTKSCKKVRKLSLPQVVQVKMVPRLAAWPKIWTAKPTGDSIGLYFFPHEMRPDEELDKLVKEVMDKNFVLRAVIDDAEMLIFPSVLLPERHQTFQKKYYLWAAFKAKEDKGTVRVEQEEDKEKHVASQPDELQSEESDQEMILMKCAKPLKNQQLPANSIQKVETCCVQWSTNMRLEREAPEERRLRDSPHQAVCTSASTAVATDATTVANAATIPSEATSFATNTASFIANHGPTDPSIEARPCSSSVFGIFVRETPKVQKLIQELERDGELIALMQGDAIGPGQWPSNITTAMQ